MGVGKTCIELTGISKSFRIPTIQKKLLHEYLVRFERFSKHHFQALNDISFNIEQGEFISIIGSNGSGKSTLLKLIAGIYQPTKGNIIVHQPLSSFLELGVGFNNDLTAVENIKLYGAILGMNKHQTYANIESVLDFAELYEFRNSYLRTFSSGMQVRLAFSVAIQTGTPILLVDEVLAVGDLDFRKKCYKTFKEFKTEGRTIVFVSHDLDSVQQFSDRVIYLEKGKLISCDKPEKIISVYEQANKVKN